MDNEKWIEEKVSSVVMSLGLTPFMRNVATIKMTRIMTELAEMKDKEKEIVIDFPNKSRMVMASYKDMQEYYEKQLAERDAVLKQCEEYFESRADAEYHTDDAAPMANEEMKLFVNIGEALCKESN